MQYVIWVFIKFIYRTTYCAKEEIIFSGVYGFFKNFITTDFCIF